MTGLTEDLDMGARILIVEDDEALRVLTESVIEDAGYSTLTASTVDEALALLTTGCAVDLVFTDLNLGDREDGGLIVARHARDVLPSVPVVYTSGAGVTDGTRALFVTGSAFLPKPYQNSDLTAALSRALNQDR
jgi:CheY-like chemotaxis protein